MLSLARSGGTLPRLFHHCRAALTSNFRPKSTVPSQQQDQDYDGSSDEIRINTKPQHQRLEKRGPLMKNMFVGVVDTDLLVYPESLNRDEQARCVAEREPFEDGGRALGGLGVFALQSPLNFGGRALIETELAYFNEVIGGRDLGLGLVAGQHNAIVQLVTRFGSEGVKERLLGELSGGESTVSAALFEREAPTGGTMFGTVATLGATSQGWLLNGEKSFVLDGDRARWLLVLASTKPVEQMNELDTTITAFLVDANANGVKRSEADETLGLNGVKQVSVSFKNVEVSNANIIGTEGNGSQVLVELLKSTRVQTSVLGVQQMKKFLNQLTKYCIETKTGGGHLMDIENIREELAKASAAIYAAESMIYMTTGLLDDFDGQDAEMEAAITKIFTGERLLQLALLPLKFVGPQALVQGSTFEQLLRDSLQFFGNGETLDSIKFYVALAGLQHAGSSTHETIRKDRNPAMNPSHVISRLFEKNTIDTPKQFCNLEHFLHPSLDAAAHWIEFSVVRLKLAVECALSRHGTEIIQRHIELVRVADVAVLLYAMVATASRASRSYCIGLKHADHEIQLANTFCREASERVHRLAKDLEQGQFVTNDANYDGMARYLFRQKGYCFEHPIAKNF
ncbi:complex I assembly factor ACAD9, mitochondrial [Culex pipiens pallens]|uniref:complex I assembly factor ACAD9, mitochondrial n=1 Tax=Culex pipiens pallens TaxID=42434 RepID=UPI001954D465|nr:complex I assembly factor ACAD9, mitochondrial [Culex pipiens pallens]